MPVPIFALLPVPLAIVTLPTTVTFAGRFATDGVYVPLAIPTVFTV